MNSMSLITKIMTAATRRHVKIAKPSNFRASQRMVSLSQAGLIVSMGDQDWTWRFYLMCLRNQRLALHHDPEWVMVLVHYRLWAQTTRSWRNSSIRECATIQPRKVTLTFVWVRTGDLPRGRSFPGVISQFAHFLLGFVKALKRPCRSPYCCWIRKKSHPSRYQTIGKSITTRYCQYSGRCPFFSKNIQFQQIRFFLVQCYKSSLIILISPDLGLMET
jgi:hypothetical protein